MDPNANLREQRELTALIADIQDNCAEDGEFTQVEEADIADAGVRLAELVSALDDWITHGGFLPDAWAAPRNR